LCNIPNPLLGDIMPPPKVVTAGLLLAVIAVPVHAQATAGADLGLFTAYVWRGISLTNKRVAQPDLYLTIPVGHASIGMGGWANIDLGKYDDLQDDFSQSGRTSGFNLAEFDPWAEVSVPVGRAILTGGVLGYVFPNEQGFTSDFNTVELYAKAALAAPLSPKLALYYDIDKVQGAYIEASISHTVPASEKIGVTLGALAGFSVGQDANLDAAGVPRSAFFSFTENGLTHLDLSAAVPLTLGPATVSPVLHVVITGDVATKATSPSNLVNGSKLWGGVSLSWSRVLGAAPAVSDQAP
jgi:hypothetical protein